MSIMKNYVSISVLIGHLVGEGLYIALKEVMYNHIYTVDGVVKMI